MTGKLQTTIVAGLLIVGGVALILIKGDVTLGGGMIATAVAAAGFENLSRKPPASLPDIPITVEQPVKDDEDAEDEDDATK